MIPIKLLLSIFTREKENITEINSVFEFLKKCNFWLFLIPIFHKGRLILHIKKVQQINQVRTFF